MFGAVDDLALMIVALRRRGPLGAQTRTYLVEARRHAPGKSSLENRSHAFRRDAALQRRARILRSNVEQTLSAHCACSVLSKSSWSTTAAPIIRARKSRGSHEKFPGEIVSLQLPRSGKGEALRRGAHAARGEFVVFIDADLDLPPEQILFFVAIQRVKKSRRGHRQQNAPGQHGRLSAHPARLQPRLFLAREITFRPARARHADRPEAGPTRDTPAEARWRKPKAAASRSTSSCLCVLSSSAQSWSKRRSSFSTR